jgi:hypothetical protein
VLRGALRGCYCFITFTSQSRNAYIGIIDVTRCLHRTFRLWISRESTVSSIDSAMALHALTLVKTKQLTFSSTDTHVSKATTLHWPSHTPGPTTYQHSLNDHQHNHFAEFFWSEANSYCRLRLLKPPPSCNNLSNSIEKVKPVRPHRLPVHFCNLTSETKLITVAISFAAARLMYQYQM